MKKRVWWLEFIKRERQELYTQLLFSTGLEEYLIEINNRAKERIWELTHVAESIGSLL